MQFPQGPANCGGRRTISLARGGKSGLVNPAGVTDATPRRGPMSHSTDAEIRCALHRKELRAFHRCNDTLVRDELALAHAKARIDAAVITLSLPASHIKTAPHPLTPLPHH